MRPAGLPPFLQKCKTGGAFCKGVVMGKRGVKAYNSGVMKRRGRKNGCKMNGGNCYGIS